MNKIWIPEGIDRITPTPIQEEAVRIVKYAGESPSPPPIKHPIEPPAEYDKLTGFINVLRLMFIVMLFVIELVVNYYFSKKECFVGRSLKNLKNIED